MRQPLPLYRPLNRDRVEGIARLVTAPVRFACWIVGIVAGSIPYGFMQGVEDVR